MCEEVDLEQLAKQAHAAWCQQMLRAGWRHGPSFDEAARTHDALVSFEDLHQRDRLATMRTAKYDAVETLAAMIDYRRGPERDFVAEEMQINLPVISTSGDGQAPLDRGRIVDWVTEDGVLVMMIVEWDDGARSEHAAFSGELARVE